MQSMKIRLYNKMEEESIKETKAICKIWNYDR